MAHDEREDELKKMEDRLLELHKTMVQEGFAGENGPEDEWMGHMIQSDKGFLRRLASIALSATQPGATTKDVMEASRLAELEQMAVAEGKERVVLRLENNQGEVLRTRTISRPKE